MIVKIIFNKINYYYYLNINLKIIKKKNKKMKLGKVESFVLFFKKVLIIHKKMSFIVVQQYFTTQLTEL